MANFNEKEDEKDEREEDMLNAGENENEGDTPNEEEEEVVVKKKRRTILGTTIRSANKSFKKAVKKRSVEYGRKNPKFMTFYNNVILKHRKNVYKEYHVQETNDKMIVFEAFMGRQFADSPKAIYKAMIKDPRFDDFEFVWAFKKPDYFAFMKAHENTRLVTYGKRSYLRAMGQAKYWVTNSRVPRQIAKRDDQVYIQCWHGTPLKKLGYDITVAGDNATHTSDELNEIYGSDAARYTYMISPSEFSSEKFASAFHVPSKDTIKTIGYPRNDLLYSYTQEDVEAIRKKLSIVTLNRRGQYKDIENIKKYFDIDFNKKVILYAPTWRDNQHEAGVGYTYDLGIDFESLKEKFGDEYIILFRTHYFIANGIDLSEYRGFVYDVSKYDDISELYVISDILITDYSSVFFDFANLKKPMLFYMYDYEEYKNNMRDFYFDLSELPGPICQTQEELENAIQNLDQYEAKYRESYNAFNKKFNPLDGPDTAQKVVDMVFTEDIIKLREREAEEVARLAELGLTEEDTEEV